jgi:DNA-binding IclR family transcriptional regulator
MSHIPAERCLDIIELLAEGASNLPLGEISERLGLPKSGTHRLLATLVELGWAEQNAETGFYRLTMRLVILGQRFYVATGMPDICQPLLDQLAAQSREFARLAVVDGESLTWIAHAQGATSGLLYQPSLKTNKVPLHVTATGKAWLASLPREVALQHALKAGLGGKGQYGGSAINSVEALSKELDATAKRGFGVAINEAEPGVTAVACVVRSEKGGAAVGTVSVAGPGARIGPERIQELGAMVVRSASELSGLWPLRPRIAADLGARSLAEA